MVKKLRVDQPAVFEPLWKPARYKGVYGGRGSGKSHFFAEMLILRCYSEPTRWACIREVQNSLKDSVMQLLLDKIEKFGLGSFFKAVDGEIRGKNGSLIILKGMQSYNAENIKSLEGFDGAWIEEAQTLSARSLRMLRPTIRAKGSEIWASWNPRHDTDAIDKFFRGSEIGDDTIVVEANWYDNPFLPDVLTHEKERDYRDDPEMAEHVWGGGYEIVTEGAYYAKQIAHLEREDRVGWFPYDYRYPVYTGWDLGVDDYTAIWFFQVIGQRVRILDYYEASGIGAEDIIAEAMPEYTEDLQDRAAALVELGRKRAFNYGRHFFPHDIGVREWGAGARTRVQTVSDLGIPIAQIVRGVAQKPEERVNAVRRMLPMCEFHQSPRVMKGLQRLRRYSRKFNEALGTYLGPLHDENSHGADAFGEVAINCGVAPDPVAKPKPREVPRGMMIPPPAPEYTGRKGMRV